MVAGKRGAAGNNSLKLVKVPAANASVNSRRLYPLPAERAPARGDSIMNAVSQHITGSARMYPATPAATGLLLRPTQPSTVLETT